MKSGPDFLTKKVLPGIAPAVSTQKKFSGFPLDFFHLS